MIEKLETEKVILTKKIESREHLLNYINKYKSGEKHEVFLKIKNFQFFHWVNGELELQALKSENFTKVNLGYNSYKEQFIIELFTTDNKIFQTIYIKNIPFIMIFDIIN